MDNVVVEQELQKRSQSMKKNAFKLVGIGPLLILLCVIMTILNPSFLTANNWINLLNSISAIWIMAMAMTLVLISGGFDLSVGASLAFSGLILVNLVAAGVPELVSILITLIVVLLIGMMTNGFLIGKLGLNFFVVTLGTMSLFRGTVYVWTDGQTQYADNNPIVSFLGNGTIGLVPVPIIIMLAICVVTHLFLKYTQFGRAIYVVGGNATAAKLSGIKVSFILIGVYGISALYAAIAGIINTGKLASVSPTIGSGMELLVAAAVLLGGTSFKGGEGTVVGTTLGVLFIGVLQNGLSLSGISSYWQEVITGAILIFAILLNYFKLKQT
ncbi:ABC transporter permease [Niallia endozanthoxylica]|uniref:ABC transporter permease n=1 Tax=Niallia endozanthoxylica TaxID=2036016 RepID=A0A5J5HVU7_9BACI|nr:ABC transporter permease [Niallia endozanthoxylica]KAA9026986.1 ABC transporter permease [Niallia endozanthoxylica]